MSSNSSIKAWKKSKKICWARGEGAVYHSIFVAYWPPNRPNCQKKKCTCVNNRCIRSKISGDQGMALAVNGSNWVGIKLLYNPGDRKFRSVGEKMLEWEPCLSREAGPPGPWLSSPGERERKAVIARRVWGSICCSLCSVSNSLSHTTLSIKWEVYFSKELCLLVFIVLNMFLHAYVYV